MSDESNKKKYIIIGVVVIVIAVLVGLWAGGILIPTTTTITTTTTTTPNVIDNTTPPNLTEMPTPIPKTIPKFGIIKIMPNLIHFVYGKFYTDTGLSTLTGNINQKMTINIINIKFSLSYTDCNLSNCRDILLEIIRPNSSVSVLHKEFIYSYDKSIPTKFKDKIDKTISLSPPLDVENGDEIRISIYSYNGSVTLLSDINLQISSNPSIVQEKSYSNIIGLWIPEYDAPNLYYISCPNSNCNKNGLYTVNVECNNENFDLTNISTNINIFQGVTLPAIYREIVYYPPVYDLTNKIVTIPEHIIYKNYEDELYSQPIKSSELKMIRLKGILTEDEPSTKYITYTQDPDTFYRNSDEPNASDFSEKQHEIGIIFIDGFIEKLTYKISIQQQNPTNSIDIVFTSIGLNEKLTFTGGGEISGEIIISDDIYLIKGDKLYFILSGYNVGLYNCEFKVYFKYIKPFVNQLKNFEPSEGEEINITFTDKANIKPSKTINILQSTDYTFSHKGNLMQSYHVRFKTDIDRNDSSFCPLLKTYYDIGFIPKNFVINNNSPYEFDYYDLMFYKGLPNSSNCNAYETTISISPDNYNDLSSVIPKSDRNNNFFTFDVRIIIARFFIATNNSIFYNINYNKWKKILIPYDLLFKINSICYSRDKNKFVAVGEPLRGKSNNIIYSKSGTIWEKTETGGYNPGILLCAFYSEKIQKFIIGGYGYLGISDDAINWKHIRLDGDDGTLLNDIFSDKTWTGFCQSFFAVKAICENYDIIIAIGGNRQSCNIIWSINGLQWNVAKISDDTRILSDVYKPIDCYPSCICYSPALNLFIVGVEFRDGFVADKLFLFSNNGKVWVDSKEYSKKLNSVSGSGITWIQNYKGFGSIIYIMSVYSICWSGSLNLFVASVKCLTDMKDMVLDPLGKTNIILYCLIYSDNGINWTVTDLQFRTIKIYSICRNYYDSYFVGTGNKSTVVYSIDAKDWVHTKFELGNQNQTGIVISDF